MKNVPESIFIPGRQGTLRAHPRNDQPDPKDPAWREEVYLKNPRGRVVVAKKYLAHEMLNTHRGWEVVSEKDYLEDIKQFEIQELTGVEPKKKKVEKVIEEPSEIDEVKGELKSLGDKFDRLTTALMQVVKANSKAKKGKK